MDITTHALIGLIFSFLNKGSFYDSAWIVFFSVAPDIVHIPFYIIIGKNKNRFLWIAKTGDWEEEGSKHPIFINIYNTTHSLFFAFLVVLPFILLFKFSIFGFFAYLSHIITDTFFHKGEWAIKIFWPLKFKIEGFSNAWSWPIEKMINSWIILFSVILFLILFLIF